MPYLSTLIYLEFLFSFSRQQMKSIPWYGTENFFVLMILIFKPKSFSLKIFQHSYCCKTVADRKTAQRNHRSRSDKQRFFSFPYSEYVIWVQQLPVKIWQKYPILLWKLSRTRACRAVLCCHKKFYQCIQHELGCLVLWAK